jgi:hypothetical protein
VQFHNVDLGVQTVLDSSLIPISSNDFFVGGQEETEEEQVARRSFSMLAESLGTGVSEIKRMMSGGGSAPSDDLLKFEHTSFTEQGEKAMALLLMMAER